MQLFTPTHDLFPKNKKFKTLTYENSGSLPKIYYPGELLLDTTIHQKIQFYEYFMLGDLKYTMPKLLVGGTGTHGFILQYVYTNSKKNKKKYIAVKYGDIEEDKKVIAHIQKNKNKCSNFLVKYIMHDSSLNPCIIMENAVGTIDDLIGVIKTKNILIDILYSIVIAIKCLFDIKLYYTDIKLKNILYQYTKTGVKIILCDLGGAVKIDDRPTTTYEPYEYDMVATNIYHANNKLPNYEPGKIITIKHDIVYENKENEKECMISWGIGIITLQLLGIDRRKIFEINNRLPHIMDLFKQDIDDAYLNKTVSDIIQNEITIKTDKTDQTDQTIKYIITNTLCNYKRRMKLNDIFITLQTNLHKKKYLKYKYKYLKEKYRLSS